MWSEKRKSGLLPIVSGRKKAVAIGGMMEELQEQIQKLCLKKRYLAQMRADSIVRHRDLLARWKSLGLETVFVGFESITQKGLDDFDKQLPVNYIEEAIRALRELNILVMGSFVISPDFGPEDFAALRRFVGQMKLSSPVFSILTPLPGTILYEEKAQEITSFNYELYDLLHSVLPTRWGLKRFYREFVRLNLIYFNTVNPFDLIKHPNPRRLVTIFKGIWTLIKLFKDSRPAAIVDHHRLAPGKLTERIFPRQVLFLNRGDK